MIELRDAEGNGAADVLGRRDTQPCAHVITATSTCIRPVQAPSWIVIL